MKVSAKPTTANCFSKTDLGEEFLIQKLKAASTLDQKKRAICALQGYYDTEVYLQHPFTLTNDLNTALRVKDTALRVEEQWVHCAIKTLQLLRIYETSYYDLYDFANSWMGIVIDANCIQILKKIATEVINSHVDSELFFAIVKNFN